MTTPMGGPAALPFGQSRHLHVAGDDGHVGCLDGLRGLAALWVFLSHAQILSGLRFLPVLSWGDMAVDLFMMISGFLMAHHFLDRRAREPWEAASTWRAFWLRRWFRIAPAYYLLLAVALALGPWLGEHRELIARHFPDTATAPARYLDGSLANVAAHVSFVFGLLPDYAFRTPLPDWSIGLEMQFYALFPFLMLAIGARLSPARLAAVVAAAFAAGWALRGYGARFEMPAFLPLKLPVFLIGVAFAYARRAGPSRGALGAWAVVAAVAAIEWARQRGLHGAGFVAMTLGLGLLVGAAGRRFGARVLEPVRAALASRAGFLAGEYAYGLYLVHLLVMIPVAGWLAQRPDYLALKGAGRFLVCVALTLPPALAGCALIHRLVEAPGIRLGKRVVGRLGTRRDGAAAPA
ncbi:acyltransferase [Mitsuaria sp. GD03876]|uniref:acyltransferase family protein n=1 Tax=Mitsuaria sp. GD03876 TaxID=2975399 RepID=UPI002449E5CC|nr:acyltransferase [Mitsuaria sp. GD03876]MDH0865357.1 acyltransferase [Mitsuaria sp. GD03876]